jgi:hypothetical protein
MRLIQGIDFLGNEPETYIFGKRRYKTCLGGFLSILTTLAILTLSLYFITIAFMRQQVNIISSETTKYNKTFDFKTVPFLFKPANLKGEKYNTSVVYPIIQYWANYPENKGNTTIITLPTKACELSDLEGYESTFKDFVDLQNYTCYDRKTAQNMTLFGNYGDVTNGYSKIHIYITTCVNGSIYNPNPDKNTCEKPETIKNALSVLPLHFYTSFPDYDVDFKNASIPYTSYVRTEDFLMTYMNKNTYLYHLKKNYIHSDFGFVFNEDKIDETYTSELAQSLTLYGSNMYVPEAYALLMIALSDKADIHYRSYIKFQSLVANVGGVVNFILLLAKYIATYISSKSLLLEYVNHRLENGKHSDFKVDQRTAHDSSKVDNTNMKLNNYTQIVPQQTTSIPTRAQAPTENFSMQKRKQLTMTFTETFFPLTFTRRYKDVYAKIDNYVRLKLSLDNLLKESDEFEKLKMYIFNSQELYVFENIDRFKSRILSSPGAEPFDNERFKKAFQQASANQKLLDVITS